MSKALAIGATGVGGGGAAVGGYLLLSNKGGSTGTEEKAVEQAKEDNKEFWDLNSFKDGKDRECVKDLFSGKEIDLKTLPTGTNTLSDANNYFGTAPTEDQQTNQSCLLINWKKTTNTDSKWSGVFTWTWTFVNGGKGFINFNVATATESGKLKLSGGFYLLEQKTEQSEKDWEVKYHKEINSESAKEISDSNFETYFPKKDSATPATGTENPDYWGFVKDKNDLTNITNVTEETPPTPTSKKLLWKWKSSGTQGVGKWGSNLKNWWELLYKESTNNFDLEDKLKTFDKGTWTLQQ